jgi:hypothetical protein
MFSIFRLELFYNEVLLEEEEEEDFYSARFYKNKKYTKNFRTINN